MTPTATAFGNTSSWVFEGGWIVLAILTHAVLIGGIPDPAAFSGVVALDDSVDVSIIEEEIDEPEPKAVKPEPVEPPPKRKMLRVAKKPPPPKKPSAPAQETPAAFDNVVLTDEEDRDSSWSAEPGSGKSVEGPIGSPNADVTGESKMGVPGGTGRGVVIHVGDLSRELFAPSPTLRLEPRDPKKAGPEGIGGEVFVRLQISAEGVPSDWRVIMEDPRGYELGQLCIETLKREAWEAQVDKQGRPITSRILYRCAFEIR